MVSFNTHELADEAALVLHLVATGVLQLAERFRDGRPLRLPYPAPLQRGLDRLTVLCRRTGAPWPASAVDLLDWCRRRPLGDWPLPLAAGAVGPGDRLLDGVLPTRVCEEWAVAAADVEGEVLERRRLHEVLRVCRAAGAPQAYVAFRRLLIERPVLTALELHQLRADGVLGLMADQLRDAYAPAPPECAVGRQLTCCRACGNLLAPDATGSLRCAEDRCRGEGADGPGRALDARDGVLWLHRELRTFVAAPGRAELRLARRLERLGAAVELWPGFDAYDLRIGFPDGGAWAADVKDWANPFLLARRVRRIPESPPWNRAYYVFPRERLRRPDYLRAFRARCTLLGGVPPVGAVAEGQLLALARRRVQGGPRDA